MGSNNYGALGIDSDDYELFESCPQLVQVEGRVVDMECGWNHNAAVLDGGSMVMWGRGDQGQFGYVTDDLIRPMLFELDDVQ